VTGISLITGYAQVHHKQLTLPLATSSFTAISQ